MRRHLMVWAAGAMLAACGPKAGQQAADETSAPHPEGTPAAATPSPGPIAGDWTRALPSLIAGIDICLAALPASAGVARVTLAAPAASGGTLVRLMAADGLRSECVAGLRGAALKSLPVDADPLLGESRPAFIRAPAANFSVEGAMPSAIALDPAGLTEWRAADHMLLGWLVRAAPSH